MVMVLCLLALPLFAVLGIFSLKYRQLTLDSLNCVFKTVTLRKCDSGLDNRIKARLTGTLLKFSPRLSISFYKHYKLITWILLILFLGSTVQSGISIYNYVVYGNCNGEDSSLFCIFDVGSNVDDKEHCVIPQDPVDNLGNIDYSKYIGGS